ncbi:signal peptide peptidase SppA [Aquibacillus salsiterrae]|uniref:Signal peptide peptidase SppA n=1 Tax=Aquibacillus salsiterrae TaxID=2950439 RepID=A0A9X3WJF6_9BACI|nr:signal peptide peptidase SppA [Aquibacillus salsiterrae]MDC3418459.1 signal peptide peptidase SppA [Aquibacillus salsiterrae]
MSRKRWVALAIAVTLLIVSVVLQASASVATTDFESVFKMEDLDDDISEKVIEKGSTTNKIAVLNLNGVIQEASASSVINTSSYNHKRFLDMLDKAAEDQNVKGIVLRVNTPGGGVVESAEIRDKIIEIKEEYNKPIYVSMGNTAASGGYYISAPADKIVAHNATITGSIGVIMESFNFAEFADKQGIDFNTIKSGPYKDIMSMSREMTESEREILQTIVDDMYNDFVQVIVEGRNMPEERVRELGDGRVYTGKQAKEVGLVDELGSLDDTIAMMTKEQQLNNPQVVEYEQGFGFQQFFGGTMKSLFGSETDLIGIKDLLRESNGPKAMYLYSQ